MSLPVYTVGYEGIDLEELLRVLQAAAIREVADVRELPLSRKRGFSRRGLAAALAAQGIGYRHVRELGCPRSIRNDYRSDRDWARYTTRFMAHLAEQGPALRALAADAATQSTALLCYEADPQRCHRTYVARAMARDLKTRVRHLTPTGEVPDGGAD